MTRSQDLDLVRATGRRFRGRLVELRVLASDDPGARVGIVVPRHGHTAVERNRLKRRIREVVRLELIVASAESEASGSAAVVAFAFPTAYDARYGELRAELLALWERAGLGPVP